MPLCSIYAESATRLSREQRIVAFLLLTMVVALLVVNPLLECHDHMDNLRHLGPNGILVMFLLFACAGICLLKSLLWFRPNGSRLLPLYLKVFSTRRLRTHGSLSSISSADLLLPLRI
jgi:hypothetical protein